MSQAETPWGHVVLFEKHSAYIQDLLLPGQHGFQQVNGWLAKNSATLVSGASTSTGQSLAR
jgi:hypothetical protein